MPKRKPKTPLHKKWREEYLALLTEELPDVPKGTPEEQQMLDLMRELIDGGYAAGSYMRDAACNIRGVAWEGPTAKGRLFADDLEDHLKKQRFLYRAKVSCIAIGGWLVGILSAWVTSHLK